MKKHFVTFYSPGTIVSEETVKPIDSWDIGKAQKMANGITERHNATPYAFRFSTRSRDPDELDSSVSDTSPTYYINCKETSVEQVRERARPNERILLSNMESNGWDRIAETTQGWKWCQPLKEGDVVL